MRSKASATAAALAEAGWLAVLTTVPVLFNIHSDRVFEPDKIFLLRAVSTLIWAALVVWGVEQGRAGLRVAGRPLSQLPLFKPVLLLTATYGLSTALSVAPMTSWWGSYDRVQGAYTYLSCVAVFAALVMLARRRCQIERVVSAALLASFPVAAYAVIQHFGLDPIGWPIDSNVRAIGPAGNAIFLGAYLIMTVPLTLARIALHLGRLQGAWSVGQAVESPIAGRAAVVALLAGYGLLLVMQLFAILYSVSRGPFVGLGAGLMFAVLAYGVCRGRRWITVTVLCSTLAVLALLALLNLPRSPLASLQGLPYVSRLSRVFDAGEGSGRVRVLIWQGVAELLRADPLRDLVGYGPETMFITFLRHYPPELAHYESRKVSADRSHNAAFDALVTRGVLGLLAELWVFLGLMSFLLIRLGVLRSPAQTRGFVTTAVMAAVMGAAIPCAIDGSLRFLGLGLSLGLTGGLVVFLFALGLRRRERRAGATRPEELLLIALWAALMAHFVEIQVGIPTAATRLYFWAYAGLALATGLSVESREAGGAGLDASPAEEKVPVADVSVLVQGATVGLLLIVLTFDFYKPGVSLSVQHYVVVWLFAALWGWSGLLIVAETAGRRGGWLQSLVVYAGISIGSWLLFLAVYPPWMRWRPPAERLEAEVYSLATHLTHAVSLLYALVFLVLILAAAALLRERPAPAAIVRAPRWQALLYPLVLWVAVVLIVRSNLAASRADIFSRQAAFYEANGAWDRGYVLRERAFTLQPYLDHYALDVGRALMEQGRIAGPGNPQQRDDLMKKADERMEQAWALGPLNSDNPRGLARLERNWARSIQNPTDRAHHYDLAERHYEEATRLNPHNTSLRDEWALLAVERQDPTKALTILAESLEIDDHDATTYSIRANAYISQGKLDQALADYDRALAISPDLIAALSGKALVLSRLDRLDEAIALNERIRRLDRKDITSLRNLALLYRRTGRLDKSRAAAEAGLRLAQGAARPPFEEFLAELEAEMAEKASGSPDAAADTPKP